MLNMPDVVKANYIVSVEYAEDNIQKLIEDINSFIITHPESKDKDIRVSITQYKIKNG